MRIQKKLEIHLQKKVWRKRTITKKYLTDKEEVTD